LSIERKRNFKRVKSFFDSKLEEVGYDGIIGVADFRKVYEDLMPVQKIKLENICGEQFQNIVRKGSIICIATAYPEHTIDAIDVRLDNETIDKTAWNIYAHEYHKLNKLLNTISENIADIFGEIPIPATIERVAVKNVNEYYRMTVSHRVIAENAGLGWRGKNELIINDNFSCAIRFTSVITTLPLTQGKKVKTSCRECTACLDACHFLKNKEKLKNYREACRRYIAQLNLDAEVCGKCVKACYRNSIFSDRFKLNETIPNSIKMRATL